MKNLIQQILSYIIPRKSEYIYIYIIYISIRYISDINPYRNPTKTPCKPHEIPKISPRINPAASEMRESWDACEIPAALVWDSRIFGGPKAPRNDGIWELGFEYL
jgi:hypothetical protein